MAKQIAPTHVLMSKKKLKRAAIVRNVDLRGVASPLDSARSVHHKRKRPRSESEQGRRGEPERDIGRYLVLHEDFLFLAAATTFLGEDDLLLLAFGDVGDDDVT